jgi:hypothetical protein
MPKENCKELIPVIDFGLELENSVTLFSKQFLVEAKVIVIFYNSCQEITFFKS